MSDENTVITRHSPERFLTSAEFNSLADVPPEVEWFANIQNPNTRRWSFRTYSEYAMRSPASRLPLIAKRNIETMSLMPSSA